MTQQPSDIIQAARGYWLTEFHATLHEMDLSQEDIMDIYTNFICNWVDGVEADHIEVTDAGDKWATGLTQFAIDNLQEQVYSQANDLQDAKKPTLH